MAVDEILAFDPATLNDFIDPAHRIKPDMEKAATMLVNMVSAFGDVQSVVRFNAGFARQIARVSRAATLRTRLVANAITAFEVLLSALLMAFYHEHPQALDTLESDDSPSDRLTSTDVLAHATIEELREWLIDRRVDAILRRGLLRWDRWFLRTIGVAPHRLVVDWQETAEVFHRRNLFVHTGGRASREYVSLVRSGLAVGAVVGAPATYVERSLDRLTALGTLLVVHAQWKWFASYRPVIVGSLQQIVYDELMSVGIWGPVAPIYEGTLRLPLDDEWVSLFRVNRWLGHKRAGTMSDVLRAELAAWEPHEMSPVLALVRLALLDALDALFEQPPRALAAKHIDLDSLTTRPVFVETRADPRFSSLAD